MLIDAGKESEYTKDELESLAVSTDHNGKVTEFPKVAVGLQHVACAYNQFGLPGRAKMIICETLEDMNELVNKFNKGGALKISWHIILDTHFVKIVTIDEWQQSSVQSKQTQSSALFKPAPENSTPSQDASLKQENRTNYSL